MSSGNFLFLIMLVTGPLVSLSSPNWIICWVGMELSFIGLIPLLFGDSVFSSLSKESAMKYFCIQALGSALLMLGGTMVYLGLMTHWLFYFVFIMSLFTKLGIFPMHFWVPSVVSGLNWMPMFILLAWQKIPPLAFIVNFTENFNWFCMFILMFGGISALVGSLIGLNQTSFRAMLGSSSVAHTGWACFGSVFGNLWTYFFIYFISFFVLIMFCLTNSDLMVSVSVLSLSGLPPFAMFIGKWGILKNALCNDLWFMYLIFPVLGAFLSLFFYLKFFYSFYLKFILNSPKNKYSLISMFILLSVSGVFFIVFF
uniref:NADH-ubiquinone oxidoreductase chain 2 n=1 Tax=Phyllidiella hageni TaxID=2873953 RepID=A0AA96LWJ2_9GAST|nr:NADH dehydrogenase subunit 2 [Phyllidiella hageni]WNR50680.1 NADH dehydrogenase subunit 2 [Phyllidiella hageni]WNR50693.1 NADH dehydrogenase subunit 2 [Phyllidiella hageni]